MALDQRKYNTVNKIDVVETGDQLLQFCSSKIKQRSGEDQLQDRLDNIKIPADLGECPKWRANDLVELRGFEPLTPTLPAWSFKDYYLPLL
jgi:hypothetical protein